MSTGVFLASGSVPAMPESARGATVKGREAFAEPASSRHVMSGGRPVRYEFERFTFDPERGLFGPDGEIRLRRLEHRLLATLLVADGRLVTKNAVVDAVWKGQAVSDDSIAQSVRRLRLALADTHAKIVQTVYGAGLRIPVPIRARQASDPLPARPPTRSDAEACVVSARELSALRTAASMRAAVRAVMRALEIDPQYVSGWCALAELRVLMLLRMIDAPQEVAAAGLAAAEKALALDPECAPALGVRGFIRVTVEWDFERGLADLDQSVLMDPLYWTTRLLRGWAMVAARRMGDAVADVRAALAMNPYATWCPPALCLFRWLAGDLHGALELGRDAVRAYPGVDSGHNALSLVASSLGLHDEAIAAGRRAAELAPDTPLMHTALASALAWAGRHEEARALIGAMAAADAPLPAAWLAPAWLGLGRRDRALEMVALSREQHSPHYFYTFFDPRLAALRAEMPAWPAAVSARGAFAQPGVTPGGFRRPRAFGDRLPGEGRAESGPLTAGS